MMESLNIQMDVNAKSWWNTLAHAAYQPTPAPIPGKGWVLLVSGLKVATFTREIFDLHTQYNYSKQYWSQANKLGPLFDSIDWKLCGKAQKQLPLAQ